MRSCSNEVQYRLSCNAAVKEMLLWHYHVFSH